MSGHGDRSSRRRFLFRSALLASAATFRTGVGGAAQPPERGSSVAGRELIRDPHFQQGFNLIDPKPGQRVVYGRLPADGNAGSGRPTNGLAEAPAAGAGAVPIAQPAWDLDQWSSRFPLAAGPPEIPGPGVRRWSNVAKSVTVAEPGTPEADLTLAVEGGREYGEHARRSGEPWVHLLVEQAFAEPPSLAELASARLRIRARLLRSTLRRTPDYTPDLHAAQFQLFLMLQNGNRDSTGFGKLVWFGIPLYDDRWRVPKEHKQQDTGGTTMFIFTPDGGVFAGGSAHDRAWLSVDKELRPLLRESLETAWNRGFLRESRELADYRLTGMNLGWEVPGLLDVEVRVRDLSLQVRSR